MGKVIAMYMRLSVADDDFEEDESNSIKVQRDLMYQYINEREVSHSRKNRHKKALKNGMNRRNSFDFSQSVAFIPRFA